MRRLLSLCFALLLGFAFLPALARADVEARHGAENFDRQLQLIGRQSSLGYRLVSGLCFAQAGVDTARNLRVIRESRTEIQAALHTLREGAPDRGIPAIRNGNIRTQIDTLERVWAALDTKTEVFLSGTRMEDEEIVKLTFKATSLEKLWRNVHQSLELMTSVNSTSEQLDRVRIIGTATEQNRLLQQAGKNACLIHLTANTKQAETYVQALKDALATFNRNIFDLTFVRPAALDAPPQPEIMEQAAFNTWMTWVGLETLFAGVAEPQTGDTLARLLPEISFTVEFLDKELRDTLELFLSL
ncbi:hypothetical protein [Celeribacter sp. ULVN23_4]